ncbi:DUF7224 domain-containing protein [Streptomyces gobiensis]|uniref:DUF7224 domain-containing protein n=1 Tax=Streptomyces gobiensis TaxID=2875706 RepID=UPI001E424404|nr:hypothetical protein [Streptomyces gobiensis]UGY92829.1 hypothetical protein test1122_14710 [Streptomyces gobiensis]
MRIRTLIRTSPATYLLLPGIALAAWAVTEPRMAASYLGGPPSAIPASVVGLIIFAASATAGAAAWQGGQIVRSGIMQLGAYRTRYALAAAGVAACAGLGTAMMGAAVAAAYIKVGMWPDGWSLPLIAFCLLLPLPYAVFGYAVGHLSKQPVMAAPLVSAATWVFIGFAGNIIEIPGTNWLRHITVYAFTTPGLEYTIAPSGYLLPLAVLSSLAIAVALGWAPFRRRVRIGAAAGVGLAAVLCGATTASAWDYTTPIRKTGEVAKACAGDAPQVCVPAPYADALPAFSKLITNTVNQLEEAGAPRPMLVTDSRVDDRSGPRVWKGWFTPGMDHADTIRTQLITAALPQEEDFGCLLNQKEDEPYWVLHSWLITAVEGRDTVNAYRPAQQKIADTTISELRKMTRAERSRWYAHAAQAAAKCQENKR